MYRRYYMEQNSLERNMQHYLWLCYFNRVLHDQGIINESEYRQMNHLIWTKYPVPAKA